MRIVALDIGGSAVKHGLFEIEAGRQELARPGPPVRLKSRDFAELAMVVEDLCQEYSKLGEARVLSISTTGSTTAEGVVLRAGHFNGYENIDWRTMSGSIQTFQHVFVLNDGRASTWAEYQGQSASRSLVHVVVGTGVGSGSVVAGQLTSGEHGLAGSFGHMKVGPESAVTCSCGATGCIETLVSGPAIVRSYEQFRELEGVAYEDVVEAAKRGNPQALRAFSDAGSWLGLGISYVLNLLDPGVVTVGGGVVESTMNMEAAEPMGPYVKAAAQRAAEAAHHRVSAVTEVRPARYGNAGGLLGAALYASARLSTV